MSDISGNLPGAAGDGSGAEGSDDLFEGLSDFGKSYLEREVQDPELRKAIAPHIKNWDRGANQKFQEIHQQYRPYRDLGDYDTVQQHINFTRRFNADPEGTLALLLQHEVITQDQLRKLVGQAASPGPVEEDDIDPKLWKKIEEKFGQFEQSLGGVAQTVQNYQQQQAQERGRQELDRAIEDLRKKHGDDFHEDFTLAMAAQLNIPLDQAHELVQKQMNGYVQKKIPPRAGFTMPGAGAGASFNKAPSDLSDEQERRNYIAQRLSQLNNQR